MPDKKTPAHDYRITLAISLSCLLLGIPVAGVAINLESTLFLAPLLKSADTIVNSPHIALFAAAFLSILASVIIALASATVRHFSLNNVVIPLIGFGLGAINFSAQLVILAIIYVTNSRFPESKNISEVRNVNGQYDANGKQFTRETWACMMGNLYLDREPWATNACSEYHYARYCTILMVNTAFLLLLIAYWPARNHLFGRGSGLPAIQGKA